MVNSPITLHRNWNETIKNVFLLYNGISEQYNDPEILEKIRSLIPEQILQLSEDDKIKSLLGWFKNDFMSWTPKDPLCTKCMEEGRDKVAMQVQVMIGMSWKLRTIEIHRCNKCGYEYTFPRYGDILKIAEIRNGRCSEWSMLFGAIMNALKTETRIVHDFLDHCWNEAMIQGKWVHMDSTLAYPISVNHPYYYEQNWGKKYEYVLAFSNGGRVEDVTQRYTQDFDAVKQRRKKNKSSMKKLFLA
ncbi:MAG: transglutaminase domain-containing protein [Candidatus Nitrosopolaris sp.]